MLSRASQVLVVVSVAALAADQSYTFPSDGRFLLHGPGSREVFQQCSRVAPSSKSKIWEVSQKELDDLEASLAKYLDERESAGKQNPPKGATYHRQYLGFIQDGEQYVYGNFYPADRYTPSLRARIDESKQAVRVCDGGPAFWGIVYRVKTKSFEEPHFNGIA